jgi:hypothetical protein
MRTSPDEEKTKLLEINRSSNQQKGSNQKQIQVT